MKELALAWIGQYGYISIFLLLLFGIIGVPVPDEVLLTFSGYLVSTGTLKYVPTVLAAFAGSASGVSISYALGWALGPYLVEKYGAWIHVTKERLHQIDVWFLRWGRWTLPVSYFLPVVRHLTAYLAGASRLRLRTFVIFAYSGALVWALVFVTAGYYLREGWDRYSSHAGSPATKALGVLIVLIAVAVVVRTVRQRQ